MRCTPYKFAVRGDGVQCTPYECAETPNKDKASFARLRVFTVVSNRLFVLLSTSDS